MKVADVMSHGVLSVGPGDPVRKAAELMLRYGVNGFPVLDQGKLVGMITQGDFLRRAEIGTERDHSKLAELFADLGKLADEYVRSHARTVADIMTREVITISPDAPLSDAVDLMVRHHVKRLPVVGANGMIGMISRVAHRCRGRLRLEELQPLATHECALPLKFHALPARLAKPRYLDGYC